MRQMMVLLAVVLVIAVIAVNGSRAQPLPQVSVAAQQCPSTGGISGPLCRPLGRAVATIPENELSAREDFAADGGDNSDPEWHWQALAIRVALVVANWAAEHFTGAYQPDAPGRVAQTIFDPVR